MSDKPVKEPDVRRLIAHAVLALSETRKAIDAMKDVFRNLNVELPPEILRLDRLVITTSTIFEYVEKSEYNLPQLLVVLQQDMQHQLEEVLKKAQRVKATYMN